MSRNVHTTPVVPVDSVHINDTADNLAVTSDTTSGDDMIQLSAYSPWSRKQLLERISTYQHKNWDIFDQDGLDPVECSKRGWVAYSQGLVKNTIHCPRCQKILSINLGDDPSIRTILSKYYIQILTTYHKESCPWREKSCSDDLYSFAGSLYDLKEMFITRYGSLLSIKDVLSPHISYSPELTEDQVQSMFKVLPVGTEKDKAVILHSLLGWGRFNTDENLGITLLRCEMCFRAIVPSTTTSLVDEHMPYCAYIQIDKISQQPGWIMLMHKLIDSDVTKTREKYDKRNNIDEYDYSDDDNVRKSRLEKLRTMLQVQKDVIRN